MTKIIEGKEEKKADDVKSQRQQEVERRRKLRVAPGVASRNLDYPAKEGWVRRVVCDRHGRLDKFVNGGWSFVSKDDEGSENPEGILKAGTREGLDSRVSQVVGTHKDNTPMHGYLMEIPEELYDEDQAVKMERIDALEGTLRAGMDADGSNPAGTKDRPGPDGRYVGNQGIKMQPKFGQRR